MCLIRMRFGGLSVADHLVVCAYQLNNATRFNRLEQLATQQPPIWGCHTISTRHWTAAGGVDRTIVLHGDRPHHKFETHITIYSTIDQPQHLNEAHAVLCTTEVPVPGREGAARFPQTVAVVREVMGADDIQVACGN